MSEVNTSVEDDILLFQIGQVASKINTAYTFLPCGLITPLNVYLTPVALSTTDANGIALFTTVVGWEVNSLTALSAISDLDAWAQNVAYNIGTVVSNPDADTGYVCRVAHTSTTGGTAATDWAVDLALGYWEVLSETAFVKLNHTAAGSGKVANFNYKIEGYDTAIN